MSHNFNFPAIVNERQLLGLWDATDFKEWRYCYEGGRIFRDEYLLPFNDREDDADFERRRDLTPIPGYARKEINRVKNSLSQRFPDIMRRGGSASWRSAVHGIGRGVDLRGTSMNSFMTKHIVPDLLVIGQVGVLIEAPQVLTNDPSGIPSQADVPKNFRPYLKRYRIEEYGTPIPAPTDSPSDWQAVMLEETKRIFEDRTLVTTDETTFTFYFLDASRGNRVSIQKLDSSGTDQEPEQRTELEAIPFTVFDIQDSLMRDACSYQITLLNMISADSSNAIDANFSTLTRQRGGANASAHLRGADDEVEVGVRKGLFYESGDERPGYISQPTGPMKVSLEFRRELKEEVHELVTGVIADLGEDGTLDAGLAYVGSCMNDGESRCWDHWAAYEAVNPSRRQPSLVSYPDDWSLKSDQSRVEEASQKLDIMNKIPGRKAKKQAAVSAIQTLWRGKVSIKDLDAMIAEVMAAPYTTSDPDILDKVAERNLAGPQALSMGYGFEPDEYLKGQEERDRRAKAQAEATADAQGGTAQGLNEGSVDDASNKEARKGDVEKAQLKDQPGVRGDGEGTKE
jgi:hypothetical protein